jgi:glycosyltransferase involved in cell wall biosynthesis
MLGKGWFPSELGGLDRYYRELLEQLPEAHGIVIGPAEDLAAGVIAVSQHSAPLPVRLLAFAIAARQQAKHADLVDTHFALYSFLPLLTGRLRRLPLVVHFQGPWADENVSAGDTSRWRRHARRHLERSVYSRASLVVTLTAAFRRLLVEQYGVCPWKTAVLPPGVDLERFSEGDRSAARAQFDLAPDAFVVCCARRLVPRMGLDVLIDAWSQELGRDCRSRLLIAGDGELRETLERQIAACSLENSVTLLGRVSEERLLGLYRAADVNIVPSTSFEGFGLVLLEAAACGTPSIVTRAGGLQEAIASLGEDLTVPAADVDALAQRLKGVEQGSLPSRAQARAWAEANSWERMGQTHRQLFERVASCDVKGSRKLRVIYLDHTSQLSGGELALTRLLPVLTDVEPHVILGEEGPLVARLQQAGVSVEVFPMNRRTRHLEKDAVRLGRLPLSAAWDTVWYSVRLARRLRRLRPDVVHTNSLKSGIYGSIAARLSGIPLVWYLHDRIDADYLPRSAVLLIRAFTRYLADVVVSNSHATRQTISPRARSLVAPPVVGLAIPASAAPPPDRPLVLGMIGRLASWKGQHVFLRAFAHAFPDGLQRAVLIGAPLFGEAEAAYGESLRQLADELHISTRVDFRGHRDDIPEQLHSLDILVHASITPEPFGQVVIEGMSAGLPVVASRGGGPDELIRDKVDGLLYPPGDVPALAKIFRQLADEPELRAQLARAAERRARDYSPESVGRQIMRAYRLAQQGPLSVVAEGFGPATSGR